MTFASTLQRVALAIGVLVSMIGIWVVAAERGLDRIVAVVNDDVVLASELEQRLQVELARLEGVDSNDPELRSALRGEVLELLIVESIQLQEAALRGIDVDDETLTGAITSFARQNNVSLEEFIAGLETAGDSYRAFREQVRREMTLERVQRAVVNRRVHVAERDIDDLLASPFFKEMISDEIRLGHILLQISAGLGADEVQEIGAKADDLVAQSRDGVDFAALAVEHSSASTAQAGGDLGWRKPSRIPSLFAEAVADLEIGAVAGPFRDASGFHIVKVIDKQGASQERSEQTQVRHILLRPSAVRTHEEARIAIEAIRARIVDGEDFVELAKEFSEDPGTRLAGGDLGWTTPEGLDPAFQRMMNLTAVNELSQPFRSSFGWHILEVGGRRQEDVSEEARRNYAAQILLNRRFKERLEEWLTEIRDESFVEERLAPSEREGGSAAPFGG